MKYVSIYLIALISLSQPISAQTKEVRIESKITAAKVFLSGAEETRTGTTNLVSGSNTIVIENITPFVDVNSIQVEGNSAYTITGVSYRNNYLVPEEETKEQESLRIKTEELSFKIKEKNVIKNTLIAERQLLQDNKDVIGSEKGLFFEDILDMGELYQTRVPEINKMIRALELEETELNKELNNTQQQLREITEGMKRYSGEIVVNLETNRVVNVSLTVKYLTTAAGWYPVYDVRSNDIKNPIDFTYKAMVYQSSGHDWDNVKLTLSTSDPRTSHTVPELSVWSIRPTDPVYYKNASRSAYDRQLKSAEYNEQAAQKPLDQNNYSSSWSIQQDNMRSTASYTTLQSSGVNTEFVISTPYSIPSNGKSYMVEVQKYNMPAEYRYYAAPKFDQDAFLLARVTNWETYSLLSGNANIYYQGTYVGESFLDAQSTSDTMSLSLGRDKDIIITRERVKEFCKSSVVGSNKKESVGIEITIRNSKSIPVTLDIADQIPISRDKEIEISLKESALADHNTETGELNWNLKLEPGQSTKRQFVYEIKFPKDKTISNL